MKISRRVISPTSIQRYTALICSIFFAIVVIGILLALLGFVPPISLIPQAPG